MPCGCFGGGSKKKGANKGGYEGPPKPPKLPAEEPIKQQQIQKQEQIPNYSSPPETTTPANGNGPVASPTGNGTVNNASINGSTAVTTPQSESQSVVDGGSTKSSGARSRAELYAKRREFFRPLYDVSLTGSNQRFATPRSSNTLPSRGKRGAYLMGDGTGGYFTADGRYVAADAGGAEGVEDGSVRYGAGSGEQVSGDLIRGGADGSSFVVNDGQYVDGEGRVTDRPPRPTSQPSALAGQWEELMDQDGQPQDEFHQKHQQIIQHQQSPGSVPPPPPPAPKQINPHFIEFQEKHHKILHDPESHQHPRNTDPELTQKLVESRLTELDKLHNEVQKHYEDRMKNGPVDVDSLVEKYTEERWRKMVELWESEGLVVEGGMVVVDEKGNVVEKEMGQGGDDGGHVVNKVTRVVERIGDEGETVIERTEQEGNKIVKVVTTNREVAFDGDRPGLVKHTEEIVVERIGGGGEQPTSVTTIVTPPTPQIDITSRMTPLAEVTAEQMEEVQRDIDQFDDEPLLELADENIKNIQQQVVERGRVTAEADEQVLQDPSSYRVSPPASPPPPASDTTTSVPPQTCTPPPSPQRDHRPSAPVEAVDTDMTCVSAALDSRDDGDANIGLSKGSATPPPSPPLQAAAEQS